MVRYLLGRLSDEEQVQVEDRAFADADFLGALEAAEADLIDAYVRGDLAESERREFERRFLRSAQRRNKVEFAAALARVAAEFNALEPASPTGWTAWLSLVNVVRGWNVPAHFAAGLAVLVCVVGVCWLIAQNVATRSQIAKLETERRELGIREKELQRRLAEEQARAGKLSAQLEKLPSPAGTAGPVASLVLLPGLSRSQVLPERVVLNSSTQLLRIEVQVEARDAYPAFRAELRTRSGDEVLTRGNLRRRRIGAAYAVAFDAPASAFGVGEYELALKGVAADGSADDVGYYYFSVQQR